jgi:hypothetical protein
LALSNSATSVFRQIPVIPGLGKLLNGSKEFFVEAEAASWPLESSY